MKRLLTVLLLTACAIEPLDGEHLGNVEPSGLPPPTLHRGYGIAAHDQITIYKFYRGNSRWEPYHVAITADEASFDTVYSEGLFEWVDLVGWNDYWEVAPVGETVVTATYTEEADPSAPEALYPTHTFDSAGYTCLYDRVLAGEDPGVAANACATGNTITNTFTVQRGDTLMVDNVGMTECTGNTIWPWPYEADHLLASRFTPPTYPYQLEKVIYIVGSGPTDKGLRCDASLPHEVLVFVTPPGAAPAAEPALLAQIPNAIPFGDTDGMHRTSVELGSPYVLEEGQEVYVAIRMPHTGKRMLCALTCDPVEPVEPDRHWWSNDPEPPYPWSQLSSFGLDAIPQIRLVGRATKK